MAAPQAQSKSPGSSKPSADELAALTVAQDLWGAGNLSPLDEIFEAQALVTSPPTKASKLAVIAPNIGRKIQLYSKETGVWLDVFESAPELARFEREKGVKAAFKAWDNSPTLLGAAKFTDVFAFQVGALFGDDLPLTYDRIAKSLRSHGRAFFADILAAPGAAPSRLLALSAHYEAMAGAGWGISKETDLSRELILKICRGFHSNTEKLAELRKLDGPAKARMTAAFYTQLERWVRVAMQLQAGTMVAVGWCGELPS
jgi:hypothetical protein